MKTYMVPMFATVEARDAEHAEELVGEIQVACQTRGLTRGMILLYQDETLDPVEFHPELFEPRSVTDFYTFVTPLP